MRPAPRFLLLISGLLLLSCVSASAPSLGHAQTLYSMDILYDGVVVMDVGSGAATFLGWAGYPVIAAGGLGFAMERVGSQIYWTNAEPAGDPLELADLSLPGPVFGGTTNMDLGGSTVTGRVGDLARSGAALLMTVEFGPNSPRPQKLASLSLTGSLTLVGDYSGQGVYLDLLAVSPTGEIYALERDEVNERGLLYQLLPPAGLSYLGEIPHLPGSSVPSFLGMTFDASGTLWVMEEVGVLGNAKTYTLRSIDPSDGSVLTSTDITYAPGPTTPGALRDLASFSDSPVPNARTSWGRLKALYRPDQR